MTGTVVAWSGVAVAVVWAAVRLLGLERGYPLVPLASFTPYAAAGAVLAVLLALALRRWAAAVVGAAAAAVLVAAVAPRALPDRGPERGTPLRVMTANVAAGATGARALVAIARRERVDVLSVQELTPALAAELERAFPYRVAEPRPGYAGTGLYARVPLEPARGPVGTRFAMAAATARVRGARIGLVAVHPIAPARWRSMPVWRRELRALPPAGRDRLRVLAGDFNATLDHRELRRLLGTGYRDAADRAGAGLRPTWPADRRFPPGVTIDHVLADARVGVRSVRVIDLPGSDHRAVVAELRIP